jgi:hypothetical protein
MVCAWSYSNAIPVPPVLLAVAGLFLAPASAAEASAASRVRLRRSEAASRSALAVQRAGLRTAGAAKKHNQGPVSAGFFNSFSEGESTYDVEALSRKDSGLIVRPEHPLSDGGVKPSGWFHESKSNGDTQAFQTHYPAVKRGVASRAVGGGLGEWHLNGYGDWVQDYKHSKLHQGQAHKSPMWFDSSVGQFDGYGRSRMPYPDSVQFMTADGWMERTINTTLTCATSGCTASSLLQAFDPETEEASHCHFSLHLHPTDFDDMYSGERLNFISLNGVTVNNDCFPMTSGCNETTQAALFTCLNAMPLDNIVNSSVGTIEVSAQISDVVDECPYEGNLLSGVPMVTCLVRQKKLAEPAAPPGPGPEIPTPQIPVLTASSLEVTASAPLKCFSRGCTALANIVMNKTVANFSQCSLNVKVYQTDFDNDEDTWEGIEFVSVDGVNVAVNATPGGNPCRHLWKTGQQLSLAQTEYVILQDNDVTTSANNGLITVKAKISDYVDECAHDGYLLSGMVDVNCTVAIPMQDF